MITSEVNFLSFGKRERLLKRTHRKYISYITISLILIFVLCKNFVSNYIEYEKINSIQVYQHVTQNTNNKEYLDKIFFLLNDMKLFIQGINYSNEKLIIDVRVIEKRGIYDIIDMLNKNNFNVISYVNTQEINGEFIYTIEVGV